MPSGSTGGRVQPVDSSQRKKKKRSGNSVTRKEQYDRNGPKNSRWKGGRRIRSDGYEIVYSPGHPYAYKNFVLGHRLVMEAHIGRYLEPHELVHHVNEVRSDNRIENLELTTSKDHASHHFKGKRLGKRWKPRVSRERLIKLYHVDGLTIKECAELTGISYGALHRHFAEFGINKRVSDPGWRKRGRASEADVLPEIELRRLYELNLLSAKECSKVTGLSVSFVIRMLRSYGINTRANQGNSRGEAKD